MHDGTITLFNFCNGVWYPSVIDGVTIAEVTASAATENAGMTGGDTVELFIPTSGAKSVATTGGEKMYVSPKVYAACAAPNTCLTFKPLVDFILVGKWDTAPINDDEYESGLYHSFNDEYDGVYMITSASWYGLIPHFEIGGR